MEVFLLITPLTGKDRGFPKGGICLRRGIIIATFKDASSILDIYTPYILHAACTFETQIPTTEQFEQRIQNCLIRFPWLVCAVDDKIAGYVYASSHREREAYQWSCECSVYVHDDFKGIGVGGDLYRALFQILKMQGLKTVYAGISLPNEASVKLHEKCGFEWFATYENVGYKLGQWQKVGWWRLQLNHYDLKPAPPLKFSELDPSVFSGLLHDAGLRIQPKLIG